MIDALVPTTPQFQALKSVYDKWIAAKTVLERAQADADALGLEVQSIAKSIVESGIVDDNYELAPTFEAKTMEKVDSDKLKALHPEIFERSNPHIDNHGIAAILKKQHGDAQLQQMLRDLDPALYLAKANCTKADVKKACTKDEYRALQNDGCLFINTTFGGEVKLINKAYQRMRLANEERDWARKDALEEEGWMEDDE